MVADAGAGVGAGAVPPDPYAPLLPPPPHPGSAMTIDPNASIPHFETRMAIINLLCRVIAHVCSDVPDLLRDFGDPDTVFIAETSARTFRLRRTRDLQVVAARNEPIGLEQSGELLALTIGK